MRSVNRVAPLVAALILPIVVVLLSYVFADAPRAPQVPTEVRIGSSPGPDPDPLTSAPTQEPTQGPTQGPTQLPPPPPGDDDDDDDDDGPDDDD
ncbi:hypothetical protein [Parasphingorhabdus pacifica]